MQAVYSWRLVRRRFVDSQKRTRRWRRGVASWLGVWERGKVL